MLELNEMKKDLYKSKAVAKFSHYVKGNLYYTVELLGDIYQFPISTVEDNKTQEIVSDGMISYVKTNDMGLKLSEDLGETTFNSEIKGSELIRWIDKASKVDELVKIG